MAEGLSSYLVNSGLQRQRAQRGAQGRPPQGGAQKLQPLEGILAPPPGGGVARQRPLCACRPLRGILAARRTGFQRSQWTVQCRISELFFTLLSAQWCRLGSVAGGSGSLKPTPSFACGDPTPAPRGCVRHLPGQVSAPPFLSANEVGTNVKNMYIYCRNLHKSAVLTFCLQPPAKSDS